MKTLFFFLLSGLLLGCSGGSNVQSSQIADGSDLSIYKTYGFYDIDTAGLIKPENYVANIEALKKSVRNEMAVRGYTEAPTSPDLKVNMGIVVEEKAQTRETDFRDRPRYMGQRNYSWQSEEIVVGYYREGTLDFHLVDAKAGKMVWWATVMDVLPEKQKNMGETIDRNIKKLFEKFPVRMK